MSAGGSRPSRLNVSGQYGVVGHQSGRQPELGQVKETEDGKRRRELVDEDLLDEESRKALEADDFILYGKASVEQYDDDEPSQKLTMEALADALPQLYADGIISRRHKDIPVGDVLAEHTLDEATQVQVGDGETLEFEAGDVLETHIEDDEFWIVANLKNNSEIAKETRLRALAGDLNGFSVTIYAKEWRETAKGQEVTELDWHAVTIGEEHKIKNKNSRFGVAEFKARFREMVPGLSDSDAAESSSEGRSVAEEVHQKATTTMTDRFNGQLFLKAGSEMGFDQARLKAASELAEKASGEDGDDALREKAEEVAEKHELETDAVLETLKALEGDTAPGETADKEGEDVQQVLDIVSEEIGDDAAELIRDALAGDSGSENPDAEEAADGEMKGDEPPGEEDDPDEEEEEEDEDEKSMDGDDIPDEVVTEEKLEDLKAELKADLKEEVATDGDLENLKEDLEESQKAALEDALPSIVEDVGEKMATGSTDDPAGGSTQDSVDYTAEIQGAFGGN